MNFDPARRADFPDAIAPDGSEIRLLASHDSASMCEVRLPPGGVSVPIRHRTVQELWYFLEGEGEVWRHVPNGTASTVTVTPGLSLTIPLGCRFQFRNMGTSDLRFLCITTPPWPGEHEAIVEPDAGVWTVSLRAGQSALSDHRSSHT